MTKRGYLNRNPQWRATMDKKANPVNGTEFKPLSGREFPRFSAVKIFFRLPQARLEEDFDVAIVGVPFDGAVSYRPGARFAPSKFREVSSLGRAYNWARGEDIF